jgi:hypothetical protein
MLAALRVVNDSRLCAGIHRSRFFNPSASIKYRMPGLFIPAPMDSIGFDYGRRPLPAGLELPGTAGGATA